MFYSRGTCPVWPHLGAATAPEYTVLQTADPTCLQFALRSSLNVRSVFVFFRERDDREEIETAN